MNRELGYYQMVETLKDKISKINEQTSSEHELSLKSEKRTSTSERTASSFSHL
jgi:hypothetical protein